MPYKRFFLTGRDQDRGELESLRGSLLRWGLARSATKTSSGYRMQENDRRPQKNLARTTSDVGYFLSGLRPDRTRVAKVRLALHFGCKVGASPPQLICVHLCPSAVKSPGHFCPQFRVFSLRLEPVELCSMTSAVTFRASDRDRRCAPGQRRGVAGRGSI